MTTQVGNIPRVMAAVAVTSGYIRVDVNLPEQVPNGGYTVPAGGATQLVVNDCATLATASAGNAIFTGSATNLGGQGSTIPFSATATGLVVSQIPAGVAISISAGSVL